MEQVNQQPPIMLPQKSQSGDDEIRFAHKENGSQEEQMQQYLYEQILQQGYDKEEFRAFLKQKYPGAEQNISKINMEQLQEVTSAFKLQAIQSNRSSSSSNISSLPVNDYNNKEYLTFDDPNVSQISKVQSNRTSQSTVLNSQISNRNRQASAFLNEKHSDPQQFAINKEILKEPQASQKQQQSQLKAPSSLASSVYQGQQQLLTSQRASGEQASEEALNQSILNSTFSSSRVIKDAQGQTIVRKEAQIIPQTSSVKDAFVKKNIEGEETSKVISCRTIETSKIAEFLQAQQNESSLKPSQNQKLKVVIQKFEIIYDGLFSSEYALYSVQTPALEWCVSRRFNDFHWLYHTLRKHHPGNFVPPIPKKTAIKEMSDEHLYQRMRSFEQFLNQILLCPTLSVSPFVSDFLSVIDQKAFEAKRKEHDLRSTPNIVDLICTTKGELTSEITPPLKEFWVQFNDLTSKSQLNYENLNEGFDSMLINLKKTAEESNKIALNFSRMHKVHEQFNRLTPLGKNPQLEVLNVHFNNFFIELANTLYDITVAFEKNFHEYIRYQKLMIDEYKSTINFHSELQNSYLEHLKKLNMKKEKLFTNPNTSKWEIDNSCALTVRELQTNKVEALKHMLPTETKQVQNEGEFFGFVNKQLYEDVCMHTALSKDLSCNRFISLSQDLALEINKLHIHIAESNMQFSELQGQKNSSLNQRYRPE